MDHIIHLKDKRKLSYAEYGNSSSKKILFFFHGWPSSRFHGSRVDEDAKKLEVRVISPDRPGYGLSDYKQNQKLLDYPDDIIELADQLHIYKFSVMGVSGGGPYAAVCAFKIPKRILKAGIVVGLAPIYIPKICEGMAWLNKMTWSNMQKPPIIKYLGCSSIWIRSKLNLDMMIAFLAKPDKNLYDQAFTNSMYFDRKEPLRSGVKGALSDLTNYSSDWQFKLEDIKTQTYLWYGKDDKNVSLKMGQYYKSKIPHSELTVYDGGHFSWIEHAKEIIGKLI